MTHSEDPSLRTHFLRGALELLVLQALRAGPRHGYGILEWLEERLGPDLPIEEGTLYPALHRMKQRGWLQAEWGVSETNRRARYYTLAKAGRERLEHESAQWSSYARTVMGALETEA
ncbi:MAG: PadR family transcriptional regulator [Gemmatimonadota bacterium]